MDKKKNLLLRYLVQTHFIMDYLRYEIIKISGRECFCHLQGGNYKFKIAV